MARPLLVREVASLLEAGDWSVVDAAGWVRQFRHGQKRGTITLSGRDGAEMPGGVLRRVLHAGGFSTLGRHK